MGTVANAPRWRLRLLGSLVLEPLMSDGAPQTSFRTQKAALLLAYLSLHPGPQPRETLIDLLWPDASPDAARNSLSVALSSLRHQLEPPGTPPGAVLNADRRSIGLREGALITDVEGFRVAERHGRRREAAESYTGELLPGFFEDWILAERERLAESYIALMQRWLPTLPDDEARPWRHRAARLAPDQALPATQHPHRVGAPQETPPPAQTLPPAESRTVTVVALAGAIPDDAACTGALRHHGGSPSAPGIFAFASAVDAVAFAVACLRLSDRRCAAALSTSEVPGAGKRLGTPAADAEALARYVRPGRLVCSEPTAALARRSLPADGTLDDLGLWRLTPARAERLFELRTPQCDPSEAPLTGIAPAAAAALLTPATRFFGREDEKAQLLEMLADARLVTILGLGGVGKTRLALETLGPLAARGDAIHFVALGSRRESISLMEMLRTALRLTPQGEATRQVARALSERPTLLVLDEIEHCLPSAAPEIAALLEAAPPLRLLTTSRRALNLPGERLLPLGPLPIPHDEVDPATLVRTSPAVALFCDRARAALPDFALTPRNAATVAALCRRLDGIPLALELTASRARVLTPGQWLTRLEQGLDAVAVHGRAGIAERHRTLAAALHWSFDLLPFETQRFFGCLSVFRGGWSLDAAEAVVEAPLALDHLAILAENALVTSQDEGETLRFTMLETIRTFAATRLSEAERDAIAERHADFFAALAAETVHRLAGEDEVAALATLERERENLHAALERSLRGTPPHPQRALALAADLARFWERHGPVVEGRHLLQEALDRAPADTAPARRADALAGASVLAMCQSDYAAARDLATRELTLRRAQGDPLSLARALHRLAGADIRQGFFENAEKLLCESLALKRAHNASPADLALSLVNLGVIANERNDCQTGAQYFVETLTHSRAAGARHLTAMALNNLGISTEEQGDLEGARAHYEESLALKEQLGDRRGTAVTLQNVARILRKQGDTAGARARLLRSLRLLALIDDPANAAVTIYGLGTLAAERENRPIHAARLWGCSLALREALQIPIAPLYRKNHETAFQNAREASGAPGAFDAAWEQGRATPWRTLAAELQVPSG